MSVQPHYMSTSTNKNPSCC